MPPSMFRMEPFRAYVGDQLPPRQRPTGYAMQSFFIGVGSVIASLLPWILTKLGVANTAAAGEIPDTVKYAFYFGGVMLLGAVSWTVFSTREYPPDELKNFDDAGVVRQRAARSHESAPRRHDLAGGRCDWPRWRSVPLRLDPQLYLLAGGIAVYGVALLVLGASRSTNMFTAIMADVHDMPRCHAPTRRRAILFLVRVVRDVDLHHCRGHTGAFRHQRCAVARIQRRRELGGCAVRGLQWFRRAGRHRDSVHGAALGIAREPPDQCLAGRGGARFHSW